MKAVFIRLLETEDKENGLKVGAMGPPASKRGCRFDIESESLASIPGSPFAYWASPSARESFARFPALSDAYLATRGAYTTDDFRFYSLSWEPRSGRSPRSSDDTSALPSFVPLAKGGAWAPYYADVHMAIRWARSGTEAKAHLSAYRERKGWGTDWSACLNGYDSYFRPGLTWPRRTNGLSFRVIPAGCIFADKGPAVFAPANCSSRLFALLAAVNSRIFRRLVELQLARTELAQSFEVGLIQRTPVPDLDSSDEVALASLARRAWSLTRSLDTPTENSHAFNLPALLQTQAAPGTLAARAAAWADRIRAVDAELAAIQAEIDDRCFDLYGISDEDRRAITDGFGASATPGTAPSADQSSAGTAASSGASATFLTAGESDADDGDYSEPSASADVAGLAAEILCWSLGVALGRFDIRLATCERPLPPEPDPFDPLAVCSPGMLAGDDGLPLATPPPGYPVAFPPDGVLVDEPGNARDLVGACRSVFDVVFRDGADARWHEAAEILEPRWRDLRVWFAGTFFERHIKMYSKSRRKAPIYWQLATPSANYSVWLYCHRLTSDSFFHVLHEFVAPKLALEERKLLSLTQEAGPNPTASQRKEITAQEAFVDELRAFRDEVDRVAPLWNPDLDDGVLLTMAPLWRLVPQHRAWQKELKTAWDSLCEGEYDWAHVAMHLWPERVVPKCAKDRSLAIAHDLEEVFWEEDAKGKWVARPKPLRPIEELVRERTSPAVKAALSGIMEAGIVDPAKRSGRRRGVR